MTRTPFELIAELDREGIRSRIIRCACDPSCVTHYCIAQHGHPDLWCATGWDESLDGAIDLIEVLHDPEEIDGQTAEGVLERACGMFGLPWAAYTSVEVVAAQVIVFDRAEEWMFRLPTDTVWGCRRCVFGNDLKRVPAALRALHEAYVAEGPVPAETFR